jgi:nitrite reductase/ring-hydroxylating ferredoxin subunit
MNKVVKYKIFCSAVFILLLVFNGCKKDKDEIPEVYVDIYVSATDPIFAPLNAINGYQYFTGGSKGIIVFRKSQNEFMAYDRHCTFNVPQANAITVDASGLIAEDAVCSSKFLLTDGSPNSGPAINPLKRYQTSFDGSILHIFN